MTKILIAGDWHKNTMAASLVLSFYAEIKTIYQVGDFGLWPGESGVKFLQNINDVLASNDQMLYVVLGNHDDYNQAKDFMEAEDGWLQHGTLHLDRIRFAPRSHVWQLNGKTFASLGGAGSIDRNLRVEGESWWCDEEITSSDVEQLKSKLFDAGLFGIDYFLSHEAPAGLHRKGFDPRPVWITPEVEHYCYQQRVLLRDAVDFAKPKNLFHGHWHYYVEDVLEGFDYNCNVFGLAADAQILDGAEVVIDLGD